MVYIDKTGAVLSKAPAKKKKKTRGELLRKGFAKKKSKGGRTYVKKGGKYVPLASRPTAGRISAKGFRTGTTRLLNVLAPVGLPGGGGRTTISRGTKRVGRPRGPSGKYFIPGAGAVGVYQYRKWLSRKRALEGIRQLDEEDYETGEYQQGPAQQQQPMQQQPMQEQSQNVLHAPNIFKGELRNVGANKAVRGYDDVEKPISNPQGDYFTDVDPFTGKQLVRKRVRERWAEGG